MLAPRDPFWSWLALWLRRRRVAEGGGGVSLLLSRELGWVVLQSLRGAAVFGGSRAPSCIFIVARALSKHSMAGVPRGVVPVPAHVWCTLHGASRCDTRTCGWQSLLLQAAPVSAPRPVHRRPPTRAWEETACGWLPPLGLSAPESPEAVLGPGSAQASPLPRPRPGSEPLKAARWVSCTVGEMAVECLAVCLV